MPDFYWQELPQSDYYLQIGVSSFLKSFLILFTSKSVPCLFRKLEDRYFLLLQTLSSKFYCYSSALPNFGEPITIPKLLPFGANLISSIQFEQLCFRHSPPSPHLQIGHPNLLVRHYNKGSLPYLSGRLTFVISFPNLKCRP